MAAGTGEGLDDAQRAIAGILLIVALGLAAMVSSVGAMELRPRVGGGSSPNGFVAGVQAAFRAGEALAIAPSVDVSWQQGNTATAYNADLLLKPIEIPNTPVSLYGGLGHTFFSITGLVFEGNTAVLGAQWGERFLAETRIGFDQAPDFRLLVGFRLLRDE